MAVYSERYNLLFVHIQRCGGASVRDVMNTMDRSVVEIDYEYSSVQETIRVFKNNKKNYHTINWFSVVRNPYDYVWSHHHFSVSALKQDMENGYMEKDFDYIHKSRNDISFFDEYVSTINEKSLITQSSRLKDEDGKIYPKTIIHLENINTEFEAFSKMYGFQFVSFGRKNTRDSNIPPINPKDLKPESRDIIESVFAEDFKNFKYKTWKHSY